MMSSLHTKNKSLLKDNTCLRKDSEATKKKLKFAESVLASLRQEKLDLEKQIEDIGGAVSAKKKDEMIRDSLKSYFSKAQLDRLLLKKQSHWSEDDLNSSILLLCLSVRVYQVLRLKYRYPLPSITCVKKYLSNLHCCPGLMVATLKFMEARAASLTPLQKILVGCFDEIFVHSNACHYSVQDRVLGPHKNAQVVFMRPLFGDWGNAVFYDFDTTVTQELINFISEKLHLAGGWVVKVWTCDLGPSNRKLMTTLKVGAENQVVPHPVTQEKVFFMTDSPHHLKNARSHLIDSGFVLNPEAKKKDQLVANKVPLRQLADLSPLSEMTKKHKLTWRHIECRGMDRQVVKIASETCSQSTGDCVLEAGEKKLIRARNFKVKTCTNLFETLLQLLFSTTTVPFQGGNFCQKYLLSITIFKC
jgi:hypothetical protein